MYADSVSEHVLLVQAARKWKPEATLAAPV